VADGIRRFRVDRIGSAIPAGPADPRLLAEELPSDTPADGPPVSGALGAFVPGPDSRRVRIATDASTSWLLETVPSALQGEEGGRTVWDVFVWGDAWLERLLLRLGPDTQVVEPVTDRDLAPEAARRILVRYRWQKDMK
jgi:predicted DNA-binding transcriptional regulator YafY